NGAGKTTLFHLITGFHRPSAGEIRFGGRPITGLRPHAVCRLGIARTFQIVQPFPGLTVLANAMVGAFSRTREPAAAEAVARDVLGVVGLTAQAGHEAGALPLPPAKRLAVGPGPGAPPPGRHLGAAAAGGTHRGGGGVDDRALSAAAGGGAHHPGDRAPAPGGDGALRPPGRAGPRREDRRGAAGGGRAGSPGDRGLPRDWRGPRFSCP